MDPRPAPGPPERWWVVFTDAMTWRWWSRFTRPRARHVFVVRIVGPDLVLGIEPLFSRALVRVFDEDMVELLDRYLDLGHDVLVYETGRGVPVYESGQGEYSARRLLQLRSPILTCASFIAYTLGLNGWIVTPQSLKRALLKHGAQRLERGEV